MGSHQLVCPPQSGTCVDQTPHHSSRREACRGALAVCGRGARAPWPPICPHRTRIGRTLPLAKKALTSAFSLSLAFLAGVLKSCGAGTRRACRRRSERVVRGEADGGREAGGAGRWRSKRVRARAPPTRYYAPPMLALAAYLVRRHGSLRVRREQRLNNRLR